MNFVNDFMTKLVGKPFDMKVAGYKVALYLPRGDEKTKGGILLPDSARDNEVLKANVGFCVAHGPDAYRDPERYPSGPWCLPGDWVVFQRYETTAAIMGYRDIHIALVADDKIDGVVGDRFDVTDIRKRDLL